MLAARDQLSVQPSTCMLLYRAATWSPVQLVPLLLEAVPHLEWEAMVGKRCRFKLHCFTRGGTFREIVMGYVRMLA